MSQIVFPDGVQYEQKYIMAADFIPEGTDMSSVANLYRGSTSSIIDVKYNMLDGADASYMFSECKSLKYVLGLDVNRIKNANHMFYYCTYAADVLKMIGTNFESVTTANYMFSGIGSSASSSTYAVVPDLNLPKCTNMDNMFTSGYIKKIGNINSPLVTSMSQTFNPNYSSITSIGLVDASSLSNSTSGPFGYSTLPNLTYLGGFKNLKAGWTNYGFSICTNLTVESLMNIINYAWDWTDYPDGKVTNPNGQTVSYGTTHKLVLGSTNLAKLTDEQKAIATNKGWTLS